jgi:uncharacterized protein YdhG (YjbR/CyaY superfamily)
MSAKKATTSQKTTKGFTADERAAMRARVRELKAEERAGRDRAAGEAELLAKISEMPKSDRVMAERIHAMVTATAPDLLPKTWYGMPAYAGKDGKVVCFFKAASKFKERYATFGFNDTAKLDAGTMWVTSFGLTELSAADEKKLAALVKKAVS